MQNSKLIFLIIGIIFLTIPVFALDHSGVISSDETWYTAENPHIVTGNVTINSGVTLTIEAGCEIKFDYAKNFTIYGTLTALGTSGNGIIFTRNGSVEWYGLLFWSGSNGSLEYCTVEYATYSTSYGV
ncbi:MAG: hypothetical protein KAH32_07755, partial [Chlamydiia bacterium]|nr:hypothetical protein [Chlamydiia bacterium]